MSSDRGWEHSRIILRYEYEWSGVDELIGYLQARRFNLAVV